MGAAGRRLRQNRCVFSARRNCTSDRSRWRRLSGRLFHSAIVLRFMDSVRICSVAIAGQHLNIIRQVHWLCLGLTGRLREKNRTKMMGQAPYVDPAPEKVGGGQLTPWTPWLRGPCPRVWALSKCNDTRLTSVCLSCASGVSREQCDSNTALKVKSSKVNLQRLGAYTPCFIKRPPPLLNCP